MNNFTFYTPTKIFFGKGEHRRVGEIIKNYGFHKILLHFGGGSIKKNGLYQEVTESLQQAGISFVPFGGVEPNPKLSLVKKGIELCRRESIEMILAVGGGSVLDSAKVIACGVKCDFDPWAFSLKKKAPKDALKVGTILTLSASGSEMSSSAVITNEEGWLKRGFNSEYNRPLFSICNPELTYTVDKFQTGCGIVDIMMHTLERYFSVTEDTEMTDRIAEGLIKSVIAAGERAIKNPEDYEARAALMWAGSLSHNDLTGAGKEVMMRCHQLEHELSGMYDFVAHGAGLSVIFPAWMKFMYKNRLDKFCQYAVRIWNCELDYAHPEQTALAGIQATEGYFQSIGMPTRLSQLHIDDSKFEEMAEKCTFFGKRVLNDYVTIGKKEMIEIYQLCQ
ncbi:iron-containing alcohol dehydrogenase [Acetivibrio sp. MSJd-27]|uniref:iron-containing alcohol dehydrogenase n=1 Tax=Acetivibrio sp. MSJd-27 TaxID=2841523 RepID=UPI001C10AC22|nr:iron-containing alcohol dehydrogenase [Acetivibrio sp. MSJd-27]MBU5450203.1 iron-containing alcohol dehydrogenase [Acetivibrio sp. MSJd-27]